MNATPRRRRRSTWRWRRAPSCPRTRRCTCTTSRRSASSTSTSSRPTTRGRTPRTATRSHGNAASLPVDEGDLLVELDAFVELGRQGEPPGRGPRARDRCSTTPASRCSSCSTTAARSSTRPSAHTDETVALLDNGLTVLQHPAGRGREHPLLLPRPAPCSPTALRGQRRGPAQHARPGHPGDGPRGRPRCSPTSSRRCRCCSATRSASTRSWSPTSPGSSSCW